MRYVAPWVNKYFILVVTTLVHAGAGNAIFPLLAQNRNPELRIHAFDYSSNAVKLVQVLFNYFNFFPLVLSNLSIKQNVLYTSPPCGAITAAVWDLSSASPPPDLAPRSADILVLVFVLSALHPSEWRDATSNIAQVWKLFMMFHPRHHMCL